MKFQNECVIAVPSRKLWDFLTDIPSVARCLPGVEEVKPTEEGKYVGTIMLKMGVVKLRLAGNITIEVMDAERYVATMGVQAADERISGLIQGKTETATLYIFRAFEERQTPQAYVVALTLAAVSVVLLVTIETIRHRIEGRKQHT